MLRPLPRGQERRRGFIRSRGPIHLGAFHEPEHIHAQDAVAAQSRIQAGRDGAQVFANDQGLPAPGLQCRQRQQIARRHPQIGSIRSFRTLGNDPYPLESRDVIDPEAADAIEAGTQHGQERLLGAGLQCMRGECRQMPVLAQRIVPVRRRADRRSLQKKPGLAPCLAPGRTGPHGKIRHQADAHAGAARRTMGQAQAGCGQPLEETMQIDLAGML
ncbi:hypothetical protein ABRZ03_00820 [Castellaniella ginsengisoli]|uniref:Uncharacterized protein n=1 Tax=Castellaniella ginsengisoli TaxID=546114 RepID=A0AB39CUW2_9BURK